MAERKWTYEDLLRLPYDGMRHEIIDGVHYVTEANYTKEQRVVARLKSLLQYPLRSAFLYRRNFWLTTMGTPELVIDILPEHKTTFEPKSHEDTLEYWLVQPALNSVAIFRRADDCWTQVHVGETLTTPLLPWFALDVRELFS